MFVLVPQARALRRQSTQAEQILWHRLRRRQLGGFRFRRQHAIGDYIADFCCPEARLVIEVDGGQPASALAQDERRTRALHAWGYRVLRFGNPEVLQETEAVLAQIQTTLLTIQVRCPPTPPPRFARRLPASGE